MCLSVCVGHMDHGCTTQKTAEPIKMPFDSYGPSESCIKSGGEDRTNPFVAVRGDKSAMRTFAELLWILINSWIYVCLFRT